MAINTKDELLEESHVLRQRCALRCFNDIKQELKLRVISGHGHFRLCFLSTSSNEAVLPSFMLIAFSSRKTWLEKKALIYKWIRKPFKPRRENCQGGLYQTGSFRTQRGHFLSHTGLIHKNQRLMDLNKLLKNFTLMINGSSKVQNYLRKVHGKSFKDPSKAY